MTDTLRDLLGTAFWLLVLFAVVDWLRGPANKK